MWTRDQLSVAQRIENKGGDMSDAAPASQKPAVRIEYCTS